MALVPVRLESVDPPLRVTLGDCCCLLARSVSLSDECCSQFLTSAFLGDIDKQIWTCPSWPECSYLLDYVRPNIFLTFCFRKR